MTLVWICLQSGSLNWTRVLKWILTLYPEYKWIPWWSRCKFVSISGSLNWISSISGSLHCGSHQSAGVNLSPPGVSVGSALKQQQWEEVGGATLCSSSSSTSLQRNTFGGTQEHWGNTPATTLPQLCCNSIPWWHSIVLRQHSPPAIHRQLNTLPMAFLCR